MKRQRGRGRKPGGGGGNPGNRPLESNGPEVKIRGTAAQIFEKYSQYARDAQSGGDRVKYENYLQHAEHYYRIMAATMPRDQMRAPGEQGMPYNNNQTGHEDRDMEDVTPSDPLKVVDEAGEDEEDGDYGEDGDVRDDESAEAGAQPQSGQQGQGGDDREGGPGRNRRRRNRNRRHNEGGGQGGGQGGQHNADRGDRNNNGGDQEARSALDALAAKQGALAGG